MALASWCPRWPPSSTRAGYQDTYREELLGPHRAQGRGRGDGRPAGGRGGGAGEGARPDRHTRGQPRPGADGPRRRHAGGAAGEGETGRRPQGGGDDQGAPGEAGRRAGPPRSGPPRPRSPGGRRSPPDRPTGCPPAVGVRWLGRGLRARRSGVGSGRTTTIARGEGRCGGSANQPQSSHGPSRSGGGSRRRPRTIPLRGRARSRCRSRCRSCRPPLSWCGGRPPMVVWPRTPSPNHMSVIRRPGGLGRSNHGGVTATAR